MIDENLMRKMACLPDPDLLEPISLGDPPGSHTYYSAITVVKFIDKLIVDKERLDWLERNGKLDEHPFAQCHSVFFTSPEPATTLREAIDITMGKKK